MPNCLLSREALLPLHLMSIEDVDFLLLNSKAENLKCEPHSFIEYSHVPI